MVDIVKDDLFFAGNVRTWDDDGTIIVFLSAPTSDVFWVFTHILQHLYKGGLVLKQICDWVRLLWTNRETVNKNLLGEWIKQAGIMLEWKAFGSFVVDYLGVARDCVPFYDEQFKERGNLLAKCIIGGLAGKKIKNIHSVAKVFPRKVFIYFPGIVLNLNWLKVKERILG